MAEHHNFTKGTLNMESKLDRIDICVIAHNEELHIANCLSNLQLAITLLPELEVSVFIINNGSTDRSDEIIDAFCRDKSNWMAMHTPIGDKANAFNIGLYKCINYSDSLVIFLDGDCSVVPSSLLEILNSYQAHPDTHLLAGAPRLIGNTSLDTYHKTLKGEALSGALYALTPAFHRAVKAKGFKLPQGLIGDDSLLAWVASHDFRLSNGVIDGKIVGVPGAIFDYHRLVPNSWRNIKLYIRRLKRYSLRHLQQKCIRCYLDQHDSFEHLPQRIEEIYQLYDPAFKRNSFVERLFDGIAEKEIYRKLRAPQKNQQ